MYIEVHVMEAMSTANITDTTLLSAFSGNTDTSIGKNLIQRIIPEAEKGANNSTSDKNSVEKDVERTQREGDAQKVDSPEQQSPEERYIDEQQNYNQQDLNNYYSKLAASNYVPSDYNSQDPLATASEGVKSSASTLSQAMMTAMQKGLSIEDAYNIRSAKAAYEANIRSLKSTIEVSV